MEGSQNLKIMTSGGGGEWGWLISTLDYDTLDYALLFISKHFFPSIQDKISHVS